MSGTCKDLKVSGGDTNSKLGNANYTTRHDCNNDGITFDFFRQ